MAIPKVIEDAINHAVWHAEAIDKSERTRCPYYAREARPGYEKAQQELADWCEQHAELEEHMTKIAHWPDGGNSYGQKNIKRYARDVVYGKSET